MKCARKYREPIELVTHKMRVWSHFEKNSKYIAQKLHEIRVHAVQSFRMKGQHNSMSVVNPITNKRMRKRECGIK